LLLEGTIFFFPSGSWLKNYRLISEMFLTVSLLPISDTRKGFKERKCDFFTIGKILDGEIIL
jgi:hypothetical protein